MSEACAASCPGDHQQPARVAVEAMDDARPLDAGDAAPGLAVAVGQQRVDERAARMARRRVDDQPGRLVDDQQVVVLVDDPQRRCRAPAARSRAIGSGTSSAQLRARRRRSRWPGAPRRPPSGGRRRSASGRSSATARSRRRRTGRPGRPGRRGPAGPGRPAPYEGSTIRRVARRAAASAGNSASADEQHDRRADRGVGDVEGVEPQVADPDVDEVDDVAERDSRSIRLPSAPPSRRPSAIDRYRLRPAAAVVDDDQADDDRARRGRTGPRCRGTARTGRPCSG